MMYGTRASALMITVLLGLSGGISAGDTPPTAYLTNVEMMQLVARGAVSRAMERFPEVVECPITLRPTEPGEADWLLESEILAALSMRGVRVRAADGPSVKIVKPRRDGGKKTAPVLDFPVDVAPVLSSGPGVPYPDGTCEEGAAGRVDVQIVVNENGSAANILIDEGAVEPFRSAVEEAVAKYRFTPALKDGAPVPGLVTYRFDFPTVDGACDGVTAEAKVPVDEPAEEEESAGSGPVASSSSAIDGTTSSLVYRVSEIEMRYPEAGRRFWLGRKRVDRYARMRIELRLRRGEEIFWAETAEHYASDRVPFGALRYLESEQYAFAQADLPAGSYGRLIEPLVVAGVIGGLVLLFYANQTGE
ncbi:MAG: energy transducer TonB [Candidatus Eisenbacteria bacterium]